MKESFVINEKLLNEEIINTKNTLLRNLDNGFMIHIEYGPEYEHWYQINTRLEFIFPKINLLDRIFKQKDIQQKALEFNKFKQELFLIVYQDLRDMEIFLKFSKTPNYYMGEA